MNNEVWGFIYYVVAPLCIGGLAYFLKSTADEVKAVREAFHQYKEDVSRDYARKDDNKTMFDRIFDQLTRIEDKLDKKMDR